MVNPTFMPPAPMTGYIEGYYGRLLPPHARKRLLMRLAELGMHAYLYAPKEDPQHRSDWRTPYNSEWLAEWHALATLAHDKNILLMAGIAPGLDFDFSAYSKNDDFAILVEKMKTLTKGKGGVQACLMFDDIDPLVVNDGGETEAKHHAMLANHLAEELGKPLFLVPRIYADELAEASPQYLPTLATTLAKQHYVFYCGSHIVSHTINLPQTQIVQAGITPNRLMVWDNLYAHDYCPRRLFLGKWRLVADAQGVMLNPTGMTETDSLLLAMMAGRLALGDDASPQAITQAWQEAVLAAGVPKAFFTIASAFDLPPRPDANSDTQHKRDYDDMLAAVEELLWRWKSPLAREWYPYLMGLRGDILMASGKADTLRQAKIMPPILQATWHKHGKT